MGPAVLLPGSAVALVGAHVDRRDELPSLLGSGLAGREHGKWQTFGLLGGAGTHGVDDRRAARSSTASVGWR